MNYLEKIEEEPYRYDFLDVMRRLERTLGRAQPSVDLFADSAAMDSAGVQTALPQKAAKPRIGDSATRRDEMIVSGAVEYLFAFGQEPHLEFPASNLARVDVDREAAQKTIRIFTKFLGLLGPQGALPLAVSEEAFGYTLARDHAFPRFLDLFNQRFLQLFFRAWADSRPIVQHDRPDLDRFGAYVLSTLGVGTPPYDDNAYIPEGIGLYAGLLAPQAKSASRLRSAIEGLFGVRAEIDEFVGTWLEFEESERSILGARNSGLGTDLLVGKASYSVQDKIRIRVYVEDMNAYLHFLPEGETCEKLVDLVFFYIGAELEWDMEIALPAAKVTATQLGVSGALGWTTWMAPNYAAKEYVCDARFSPVERVANRRRKQAANM
jgi:type VI secretion system protein ImpH